MIFESTPESVATHPWMIYAGLVVGVLLLVAGAVPKFFGSLGQAWHEWLLRRRTAAVEADDADIIDLRRERDYLAGVAAERLRELRARDVLIREHAPWDWERYEAAIRAGHAVSHPPPLMPHIPPPTEPLNPEIGE